MKILIITNYFGSHRGGLESIANELFHTFSAKGEEVVWVAGNTTPAPDPTGRSHAVPVRIFNYVEDKLGIPFPFPSLSAFREIAAQIRRADLVILNDCMYLSSIAGFLIARLRRVPTIVIQHIGFVPFKNALPNALMRIANATLTRPMLSRADQVVFYSEITKEFFSELRFRRQPEMIFNGVDAQVYRPGGSDETREQLRRHYGLPLDQPLILFVGRFVEKKGIDILKRMASLRPHYNWVFAGWGPLDPRAWKASNVHVLSGLQGASIAPLYRACDLLVLPSVGEGLPLVVQEALASGLPVVCGAESVAADPAMALFVRGVAVDPRNHDKTANDFLSAIESQLASEGQSHRHSQARRAFAIERYSWPRAAERYLEIASRLVAGPPCTLHSCRTAPTRGG